MIVLDTNVVSEAMRPDPHPAVVAWLDRQSPRTTFLTTVTAAELRLGAALLPRGRRQRATSAAVETAIGMFEGRVLPFDLEAASEFASRVAAARHDGRSVSTADAQIAAIAAAHGFTVATRDVQPFRALGAEVLDPFDASDPFDGSDPSDPGDRR